MNHFKFSVHIHWDLRCSLKASMVLIYSIIYEFSHIIIIFLLSSWIKLFFTVVMLKKACKHIDHMFRNILIFWVTTVSNLIRFCEFNEHIYDNNINMAYDILIAYSNAVNLLKLSKENSNKYLSIFESQLA